MQSTTLVNRRYRDVPEAQFQFVDAIFNTQSTSYVDTGTSIIPRAGINLVLFRANSAAGAEGITLPSLKAQYAGADIGETQGYAKRS